ncbi:MAG TPA: sigma 54-interacting transcriptional regulator [Vicinamibacterales bacterium]|nr:sigma 54-interacting transcriptional regulator [Vicinamibacterales bacterium]
MLRFDRYLSWHSRVLDLASGNGVELKRTRDGRATPTLFHSEQQRTLIDLEPQDTARIEVWEDWTPRRKPPQLESETTAFIELLDCARHGAPRAFDLSGRHACDHQYMIRALAREARVRGWVPIGVELLALLSRQPRALRPTGLANRSLVIFAEAPGLSGDAVVALVKLAQRDARPHVLVRTLARATNSWPFTGPKLRHSVHENAEPFGGSIAPVSSSDVQAEAQLRWSHLLQTSSGAGPGTSALDLAELLAARDQPFEARALVEQTVREPALATRGAAILTALHTRAADQAAARLAGPNEHSARGWEMVDDFVGVLQLCQDLEDEQTALARVGAYLRDRLQASSVAFVVREGTAPRILSRVGSEAARTDLALRSIDTGVAIRPSTGHGPVESAWPVRHAAEVIGAVWCRWSAGTPVASQQASALLGIAAAAAAPSVRLALARRPSVTSMANPVPELVGESASMIAVRGAIVRAAASPFPVVIEGESGSGKELAARAIHSRSVRRDRRFCAINCAALVDELVETELFGHVRGAFTGAATERAGVFEEANGGTLFLDEVVELGARVQAKLLRTLQEGEIRRVGESQVRKVDVRIVAATNRPLATQVTAGTFRADLWYRLDVIRVTLPPLRERLEDLPGLVDHVWRGLAARTGSRAVLSPSTIAAFAAYDWPGNIRELQNVLASLLVSATRGRLIGPSALPAHIARVAAIERGASLADARKQFEERYVRAALARAGGRTAAAARDLGLSRQGLAKLMGRLGIGDLPTSRSEAKQ